MDPLFRVDLITATPNPQLAVWAAMHQDYSEKYVYNEFINKPPSHRGAGEIAVKQLLKGERGHYGPLEHAQIVLAVGYFPHSVMQQARTHRVGVSFDVQSMRYTGDRICKAAKEELSLEEVFYLRAAGFYADRHSGKYEYTQQQRNYDLACCKVAALDYSRRVEQGMPYEQARGLIPFDIRQHFVVSFSLRALMHFLDLRSKADAQGEIQALCDLMLPHFQAWSPEIAEWYCDTRLHKARLAP